MLNRRNNPRKRQTAESSPARRRWPAPAAMLAVAGIAAIMAVGGVLARRPQPAPPAAEQILARREWTEAELTTEMSRLFQIGAHSGRRQEMAMHLRRQMDAMPPENRRRIAATALKEAMRVNLERYRAMTPEERSRWLRRMDERTPAQIGQLAGTAEKREGAVDRGEMRGLGAELREFVASPEGKEVITEATRVIFGELTAEERAELIPLSTKLMKIATP